MVLLVSYLEYTYQNDCLSKMNVRKKGMVALAFCINLYWVCIISDTTGNQVCLVINTKKKNARRKKQDQILSGGSHKIIFSYSREITFFSRITRTDFCFFFAQLTVLYNIYVSHECSRILHCPK